MTDLEQRLREALHEDAARARLVNPTAPPATEARALRVDENRRPSARKLLAVAAAVAVVAAGVVAVVQDLERDSGVDAVSLVIDDIRPGSTVALPPAPLTTRGAPALVWSGTEMIVWGTSDIRRPVDEGAAYDLARGTWRDIAPAPIEARALPQVAWTGNEMLLVGGAASDSGSSLRYLRDGGAYNPSTDTWRRIPDAPIEVATAWGPVWTGDELIIVGLEGDAPKAAAYSPETGEWRRLADPPSFPATMVWAGDALLMTGSSLVRYDPELDEWETVEEEDFAYLVAVPGAGGEIRSVLALPTATGAPVTVLDPAGRVTGTLPGHPGDRETYGEHIEPGLGSDYANQGTWLGEEALFWILSADSPYSSVQTPQPWGLNPETGTWRPVGTSAPPFGAHLELVADDGVLVGWGHLDGFGSGPPVGIAYRPPELGTALRPLEDRLGLPEPGEAPADPVAAEEEVRAAFVGIFDSSSEQVARAQLSERPDMWLAANTELSDGQYGVAVRDLQAEVDEVMFTTPTRAAVRFRLIASDPQVPKGYQIGNAVLVDDRWVVSIETTCNLVAFAAIQCDPNA